MKNKITFIIAILIFSATGFAQELTPSILSSQGGSDQTGYLTLEWTLGENIVETVTYPGKIYTQGFHQSYLQLTDVIYPIPGLPFTIRIYPNPVDSWLNIIIHENYNTQLNISLFDLDQRIIRNLIAFPYEGRFVFDFHDLPNGIYLLKIITSDKQNMETFKVVKY